MTNEINSWKFYVAGVKHHSIHKVIDKMKEGQSLDLTLEPTNPYDPHAVRIEYHTFEGEVMIGYVPAKISEQVSQSILDPSNWTQCVIVELDVAASPWKQLKVKIERRPKDE